jgi:hypothetical protein
LEQRRALTEYEDIETLYLRLRRSLGLTRYSLEASAPNWFFRVIFVFFSALKGQSY